MIRTIVVDDEPYASKRICRLIGLIDPSFQVVATAMDGEQALEILKDTPCDLIFTDIRMPIMDGVELIEKLRQTRPNLMLVVVSGYSDYAYMSTALRAKAVDYLLKPVDEQDMRALLARVKKLYDERNEQRLKTALARQINRISPVATEQVGTERQERNLHAMLFCAGAAPTCENADMCPGSDFWTGMRFGQRAKEALTGPVEFCCEFTGNVAAERIVFIKSDLDDGTIAARRIFDMLKAQNRIPVSCACHRAPVCLEEVSRVLHELRVCLETGVRIGHSELLVAGDLEAEASMTAQDNERAQALLSAAPEMWDKSFAQSLEQRGFRQHQLFELFYRALRSICGRDGIAEETLRERENLLQESFSAALSVSELCSDIAGLCAGRSEMGMAADSEADFADRIAAYLEQNYAEYITNQLLSSLFGYVPSYLSAVFRRAKGVSPVEYLTQLRMEKAKKLLTEKNDMLIKDIAVSVGYKNQYHFSRTFKKYEGMWPTDYREKDEMS